jgi:dipeptidyl aminopeptidase/acylaminoacyl peptidase
LSARAFGFSRARLTARVFCAFCLLTIAHGLRAESAAPAERLPALTLDDLYSEYNVIDVDLSPSGKLVAAVIRRKDEDGLICLDLATGQKTVIMRINKDAFGNQLDVRLGYVIWKTENRLLLQVRSTPNDGVDISKLSRGSLLKLGYRLYAIDRDGKNVTPLLGTQHHAALEGAWDTSNIASMLWKDPDSILVRVGGWEGRSLFRVDVNTGKGKIAEKLNPRVVDWWLDVDGNAAVRVEYSAGSLRYYRRLDDGTWKKYHSVRRKELDEQDEFAFIGPSEDPTKFYVLARPQGRDRLGVYLYDLTREQFGEPLIEDSRYDIVQASTSADGKRVMYHCYDVHVRICDFSDPKTNAYMRGLRRFFEETVNVRIIDASDDDKTVLLLVDGPQEPPSYYYYLVDQKRVEFVGLRQGALRGKALPSVEIVTYQTRDGKEQSGYLTRPPGAKDEKNLPLVVMPHGGPQVRDRLEFDHWVQYLAARGYAVFQPNFRGSSGFGRAFEESGYRERGRRIQDDITDSVKALTARGSIDPARVCIVGMSFGGFAALAGAAFTPDLYRCAVSIAGVSDYEKHVRDKKRTYGGDSETFEYYAKSVGDPDKDQQFIRERSPAFHAGAIKIPVLLIHGDEDDAVDFEQSEIMQNALERAGRKTELIRLEDEGHGGFDDDTSKLLLSRIGDFLWKHLGKGYGVTDAPVIYSQPE